MDAATFLPLAILAATGEDRFTMRRGSFRYRRILRDRTLLHPVRREETPEGERHWYADRHGNERLALLRREIGGRICLTLDTPEACPWDRFRLTFPSSPAEHFYGGGEVYAALDLKGQRVRVWVAEHQNALRIGKKLVGERLFGRHPARKKPLDRYESYHAQPTFVSSERYYVHADTRTYGELDFRPGDRYHLWFHEPPTLWFEVCGDFPSVSRRLTELIGRPGPLPDWVHNGAILAVQGGTEAIEKKLAQARDAGAKVCGIWSQDWCGCRRTGFGYQVMWNWQWDEALYPDLPERIRAWEEQGVRFLGYINPFLALEGPLYREAAARGYCVKNPAGEDYRVTITTFPAAMVDLTNSAAVEWYKSIIKRNLLDLGFAGWMADFGEYLPTDAVLASGEAPALLHNRWPVLWAELNRDAIAEAGAEDVFFFTRAGFTGTAAASPMLWTGDQHVDWSGDDGLPSVIPAMLSLAMSGCGISHSDAGGYTTVMHMTRSKELLLRWEEMNAFSPLYRFHEGNQPTRNAQFGDDGELLSQMSRTSRWHAALKPYLLTLERELAAAGTPLVRPLFYHYDESAAYTEQTEYLLGRDVLAAPVLEEGRTSRSVYLPEDDWVHIFTGEMFGGGVQTIDAPIGRPPVFLRRQSPWFDLFMNNAEFSV